MFDQHSLTTRRLFLREIETALDPQGQGKDVALQEARGWRASKRPPYASRGKETPAVTAIAPNLILDLHHRHHHARIAQHHLMFFFFVYFLHLEKLLLRVGTAGLGWIAAMRLPLAMLTSARR